MKKRTAGFLTAAAIFMAALCFLPAAFGKQEIEVPEVRVLPAAGRLQEMTEKVEEEIAAAEPEPVRGIYVTGAHGWPCQYGGADPAGSGQ